MRIGHGYDVHAATDGDRVTLGGTSIPCTFALAAHSDGDVVLHALCDALLGATALGDIGRYFPDDDARWRNADSRMLLGEVVGMIRRAGWRPANVDITVIAGRPRLGPHVGTMREVIAELLDVAVDAVSVKATTHEGLDALGRCEGIGAHAVCLIEADV